MANKLELSEVYITPYSDDVNFAEFLRELYPVLKGVMSPSTALTDVGSLNLPRVTGLAELPYIIDQESDSTVDVMHNAILNRLNDFGVANEYGFDWIGDL